MYTCIYAGGYTYVYSEGGEDGAEGGESRGQTTFFYNTLQLTATLCNTLQHTATLCNTLQHTASHRNIPHHTAANYT